MAHTMRELDLLGLTEDNPSEMNQAMRKHIVHMMEQFCDEGHSGFSAMYAVKILHKLMRYVPLTPLTGEDDEWSEVSDGLYQNKRFSRVFKEGKDGQAYDIEGKIFWEWNVHEDGTPYKCYYGNGDSRMPVTFPYEIPDKPIYEYRYSDADPSAPPQTEEGLL